MLPQATHDCPKIPLRIDPQIIQALALADEYHRQNEELRAMVAYLQAELAQAKREHESLDGLRDTIAVLKRQLQGAQEQLLSK